MFPGASWVPSIEREQIPDLMQIPHKDLSVSKPAFSPASWPVRRALSPPVSSFSSCFLQGNRRHWGPQCALSSLPALSLHESHPSFPANIHWFLPAQTVAEGHRGCNSTYEERNNKRSVWSRKHMEVAKMEAWAKRREGLQKCYLHGPSEVRTTTGPPLPSQAPWSGWRQAVQILCVRNCH